MHEDRHVQCDQVCTLNATYNSVQQSQYFVTEERPRPCGHPPGSIYAVRPDGIRFNVSDQDPIAVLRGARLPEFALWVDSAEY